MLIDEGILIPSSDHRLTGRFLESRVRRIFQEMGFIFDVGPRGLHDAVIRPPSDWTPTSPLVAEIKSSKDPEPSLDDLRQLDDWVFELSGEMVARRGEGKAPGNLILQGFGASIYSHPTPHKGIMVFNGPVGIPFDQRTPGDGWLNLSKKQFAEKRCFCIVSMQCLVEWLEAFREDRSAARRLWESIHSTAGVMALPT
jgi:hypothetical protein